MEKKNDLNNITNTNSNENNSMENNINYDDLILDDRTKFFENKVNKLYLYSYINGTPTNLDFNPTVNISDPNGDLIPSLTGLTTILRTQGVYEVEVPAITGYSPLCISSIFSNFLSR